MSDIIARKILTFYLKSHLLKKIYRRIKITYPFVGKIIKLFIGSKKPNFELKKFDFVAIGNLKKKKYRSAYVVGNSRIIAVSESLATLNLNLNEAGMRRIFLNYLAQEELLGLAEIDVDQKNLKSLPLSDQFHLFGSWYALNHPSSENWMHLISEILPEIQTLNGMKNVYGNFGLLLDANIPKSGKELISRLFGSIPIIYLEFGQVVLVENLINIDSPPTSFSFFWPRNNKKLKGLFEFNVSALKSLQLNIHKNIPRNADRKRNEIGLVVKRVSYFRQIRNYEELRLMLLSKGFIEFTPTESNLQEQIDYFRSTSKLVMQAGAALANLIFVAPNTNVIVLIAKSDWVDYAYFREYANVLGVKFIYVLGESLDLKEYSHEAIGTVNHPMNIEFEVSVEKLAKVLNGI